MDLLLARTVGLLLIAILVALIARRLSLPYTVGLVATGVGLALANIEIAPRLTHDIIFDVILPPLLFEASLSIRWNELRGDLLPVLVLSVSGVVISALVVAFGMSVLLAWPFASAAVFGVLIAATDPVAVIAMFKDTGLQGRLRLVVETESLFNDGVAAVLFGVAIALAKGATTAGPGAIAASLALTTGGGIVVGLVCGAVAVLLAGRTSDRLAETALTTAAAYGSFLLAERLQSSGVLACVSAGLVMGNFALRGDDRRWIESDHSRTFVVEFWEFAAFVANSFVFLMIGVTVAQIPFATLGAAALAISILLVLFGRLLTVYPLCGLFWRSRWAIPLRDQHVLWWGGLRGALALALALALPASLALHDEILIATFGVVAFSIIVQGLTMKPLMRHLGVLAER